MFVPVKMGGHGYFVQSFNVTPDGKHAYIGYDHNPGLRKNRGNTKIADLNLCNHHYHTSRPFQGGHGQSLAYNCVKRTLWLLVDPEGSIHKGRFDQISLKTLKPIHHIHFRMKSDEALGDSLTFDNDNHVYNENRIWSYNSTKRFKQDNIVLYRGALNRHHVKFNLIKQGIRHAVGHIVQALAYNPRTRRLYIEANDAFLSVPVQKLGHLRPKDVRETIMRQHREYEGLSFDRRGFAYILMNGPKEIMKSTRIF